MKEANMAKWTYERTDKGPSVVFHDSQGHKSYYTVEVSGAEPAQGAEVWSDGRRCWQTFEGVTFLFEPVYLSHPYKLVMATGETVEGPIINAEEVLDE